MWRRGKSRRSARDYKVKLNLKKSKTFHQLSLLFKIQIGGGDLEYKDVSVWGPPCSHTTHTFFLLTKGDPKRQKVCSDTENQNSFLSFFLYIIFNFLYLFYFFYQTVPCLELTFKLGCLKFEHRLLHITMHVSAKWVILMGLFILLLTSVKNDMHFLTITPNKRSIPPVSQTIFLNETC